jgi:hypothetical protein
MGLLANERAYTLSKMAGAEVNMKTVPLTIKTACKRISTESGGRRILRTVGTVDMSLDQSLRLNSTD